MTSKIKTTPTIMTTSNWSQPINENDGWVEIFIREAAFYNEKFFGNSKF